MRTLMACSLVCFALAAPVHAEIGSVSGPPAGLRTPALDMGQAQVVFGMNKKGNYGGGN